VAMFALGGSTVATQYIDSRNFTEPMFVFAIMVIAGTRPVLQTAMAGVNMVAKLIPLPGSMGFYWFFADSRGDGRDACKRIER